MIIFMPEGILFEGSWLDNISRDWLPCHFQMEIHRKRSISSRWGLCRGPFCIFKHKLHQLRCTFGQQHNCSFSWHIFVPYTAKQRGRRRWARRIKEFWTYLTLYFNKNYQYQTKKPLYFSLKDHPYFWESKISNGNWKEYLRDDLTIVFE